MPGHWSVEEGSYPMPTASGELTGGERLVCTIDNDNAHLCTLQIAHADGTVTKMVFNRNGGLVMSERKTPAIAEAAA